MPELEIVTSNFYSRNYKIPIQEFKIVNSGIGNRELMKWNNDVPELETGTYLSQITEETSFIFEVES